MKIKISSVQDKVFYEELINIMFNIKGVKKNPNKRVNNTIKTNGLALVIIPILIIALEIYSKTHTETVYIDTLIYLFIFIELVAIIARIRINKMLKEYLSNTNDSTLIIDEKGVELDKENTSSLRIKWESLDFVLIKEKGIIFISKGENNLLFIDVPVEYINDVKTALNKYNKNTNIIE